MANREIPSIETLFSHTQTIESRVGALEKGFETVNAKLDKLFGAVSSFAAQQPPWRVADVLGISRDLLTIGALLGGTVIFIANALSSGPVAALQKEIQFHEQRTQRLESKLERLLDRMDTRGKPGS